MLRKVYNRIIIGKKDKSKNILMTENGDYDKYTVGKYTYGRPKIYDFGEKLIIGRYCSIGPEVKIVLGGNHRIDWISTYPFNVIFNQYYQTEGHPSSKGLIEINNDVWIGAESLILSGVSIGNGAVIGARTVVSKSVPPYAIAVGNPMKIVGYRFTDETIKQINNTKWWQYDVEELRNAIPYLQSSDIKNFLKTINKIKNG